MRLMRNFARNSSFWCTILCLSVFLVDGRGSPVVDNINVDDEIVENDKISPEIEDILIQKKRRWDCPLCDTSVYSYCSDKLLHDACCCLRDPNLPKQCQVADCSFLHANSCQEHRLITACCCNHLSYNAGPQ